MVPYHTKILYPRCYELQSLPLKTLDVANNGVHVSANAHGNILLINGTHEEHGVIVAIPYEPFDGKFLDQEAVREYRKKLLGDDLLKDQFGGFGLFLEGPDLKPTSKVALQHISDTGRETRAVRSQYTCQNGALITTTVAVASNGEIRQMRQITNNTGDSIDVTTKLRIQNSSPRKVSVSRASYGQLTEGGIIPMPESACTSVADASAFHIYNEEMGAVLEGHVETTTDPADQSDFYSIGPANQTYTISCGQSCTIVARLRFRQVDFDSVVEFPPKMDPAVLNRHWDDCLEQAAVSINNGYKLNMVEYITWRNVDYVLDNCSIKVTPKNGTHGKTAESPVCVITDHVALPLGWNRDNYWQLALLMKLRKVGSPSPGSFSWYTNQREAYDSSIDQILFGHLNWIFRQAKTHSTVNGEKIVLYKDANGTRVIDHNAVATKTRTGFWPRSFLIDGTAKDGNGIFQLDQQCYPLLELCDFWDTYQTDERQSGKARRLVAEILGEQQIARVLKLLTGDFDGIGLIKTDETPGDDEARYGYLFSCNLLVWYTFKRLIWLLSQFGQIPETLEGVDLPRKAENLRKQMLECFKTTVTVSGAKKQVFAYECGFAKGTQEKESEDISNLKYRVYGDGNDIPTLMTKDWGFVQQPADVEIWQNTMDWMFDPVANRAEDRPGNEKTYWVGEEPDDISGLGSIHSAKPWPLGIYQEWRYYTMCGTELAEKAQHAWDRLEKVAQWDGTFSETVDMRIKECDSKAWFS